MLRTDEIGILQKSDSVMVRSMCGVKLVGKKLTKDQMQMLEFNETMGHLERANSVRWYGHVMRKDKNNFLRRALDS